MHERIAYAVTVESVDIGFVAFPAATARRVGMGE
jgi:hypothetical protein